MYHANQIFWRILCSKTKKDKKIKQIKNTNFIYLENEVNQNTSINSFDEDNGKQKKSSKIFVKELFYCIIKIGGSIIWRKKLESYQELSLL